MFGAEASGARLLVAPSPSGPGPGMEGTRLVLDANPVLMRML